MPEESLWRRLTTWDLLKQQPPNKAGQQQFHRPFLRILKQNTDLFKAETKLFSNKTYAYGCTHDMRPHYCRTWNHFQYHFVHYPSSSFASNLRRKRYFLVRFQLNDHTTNVCRIKKTNRSDSISYSTSAIFFDRIYFCVCFCLNRWCELMTQD